MVKRHRERKLIENHNKTPKESLGNEEYAQELAKKPNYLDEKDVPPRKGQGW